jgi:hypothetical protein
VKKVNFHRQQLTTNFVARPRSTYPLYTAQIFSEDVQQLTACRETLPQVVAWCAERVEEFDTYQRVRREFERVKIYSRGYKRLGSGLTCFVLITLVKT